MEDNVVIGSYIAFVSIVYSVIFCLIFIGVLVRKIGLWGIFSKTGEKEWKTMVPFYNQIVLLKKCKLSPWLILLYIDFVIPFVGFFLGRDVSWALIICGVGFLCYRFLISIRLGQMFKKGDAFSFFMALFPVVFYPVLGWSKNEKYTELVIDKKAKTKEKKA